MFVGLHRHSHYSKRDAIAKIPDIVDKVGRLGQKAWALTDHGTTSGLMEGYKATQKYNKEHGTDIKFIFGCEVYWTPNYFIKDRKVTKHLILLAKNEIGYKNLLKLVTIGYGNKGLNEDNFFYTMRLTTEDIAKHKEGIIATSACIGGILSPSDENGWNKELAYERAKTFKNLFGDDFYLEVQTSTFCKQLVYNKLIQEMSRDLDIPLIVTEDSHYIDKENAEVHRYWLGNSEYYSTDDYFIHTEEEVLEAISYLDNPKEIVANTVRLADKIEVVNIKFGGKNFPKLPLDIPAIDKVRQIVSEGWRNKIENIVPVEKQDVYRQQIEHELEVLEKCDYLTYFLMNNDFLSWARSQGIRTGIGRGSVGGSLVAYLMDITRIDPIKYGLIFERFAHAERVSSPDVDTDLPNARRGEVIQYLIDKYKEVFHVRTFGTMAEKASIQRASKALGYTAEQVRMLSKEVNSIKEVKDEKVKNLANSFFGIIQNYGVHASAIMLFPDDANNYCAIEKQGDNFVCAYEYTDLEKLGLLKLDLLGIKTLDVIQNCLDMIDDHIDIDNLPLDDEKTFDMLCSGDVKGCFQVESRGMVELLKSIQPKNIFDLVPLVALYRPSTIQSGMINTFVNRRNGQEEVEYIHKDLARSTSDTYGVLLYQEQAMQIVQDLAGYTLGKADMFRRAIGHKVPEEMAVLIPQFVEDGKKKGYSEEVLNKVAEWLTNCASYQFNKSHSASYGYTTYMTAYLKAHYPAEYLCAYLNAYRDDSQDDLIPYIEDAKAHGIKILPPDASKNTLDWTVVNGNLRVGICYIKNVGTVELPITDYSLRKINRIKAINIAKAGAVDYLADREAILNSLCTEAELGKLNSQLERYIELRIKAENTKAKEGTKKAMEAKEKILTYGNKIYDIKEKIAKIPRNKLDKAVAEREVLGFSFCNPFDNIDFSKYKEPCKDDDSERVVLGIVTSIRMWKQKNGKDMCFFKLACPSGVVYDLVMFASVFTPLELNKVYRMTVKSDKFRRLLE